MKFSQVPPGFHVVYASSHFGENDDGFDGRRIYSELFSQIVPANQQVWNILGNISIFYIGWSL